MMEILDVLVKKVKTGMLQGSFIHFYVFVRQIFVALCCLECSRLTKNGYWAILDIIKVP